MPRKNITEATPKGAPKSPPKERPRTGSKRVPITEPEQAPRHRPKKAAKPAPAAAPIVSPEGYSISFYLLPGWEDNHSTSPHSYGNRGMALYQSHTEADGKAWLRDNEYYGHFAAVERINGKIGKSWHVEIEPMEEETSDDDLSLLDPDDVDLDDADLLNPAIFRAKIENAKLKAQLEARNGHSSSIGELLQGLRALDEMRGQGASQKSLAEQLRELREINEIITPRRESNPGPTPQPQVDPKVSALKIIAENPSLAEIAKEVFGFGSKGEGDGDRWAEVAIKAVENGEASKIVTALTGLVSTGLGNLISAFTPRQQQTPAHQAPAPQASAIQPPQQQVAPANVEQPAQLPANDQQQSVQAAQTEQGPMQMAPVDALVYSLIAAMEKQAPIADAQNIINIAIVRNPELGDSVDEILNLTVDQILALLTAYHPPVAQMAPARTWLQSLVNSLSVEGDEFDEFTEIDKGEVKL